FLAERAGISEPEVRAAIEDSSWKEKGKANREALTDLGLWGVPSLHIGAYSTWGQDRIPILEAEIARFSSPA
ncbi:MAG: DsbA family protein, partial [Deltaproteobacteria bacterium]|nr:DsbA family protein [Deltaproteobacteria bacterium]